MKRILILAVVSLAVGVAAADGVSGRRGAIRGRVVDPLGRPVAGARVLLVSPRDSCRFVPGSSFRSAITGSDGEYELPAPSEPMEVMATHPELGRATEAAEDGAVLRFSRPAWVTGTVSGPATLRVVRGTRTLASVRADGAYRLGPLPPETPISLVADSPGHRRFAARLELEPGERKTLDISLDRGRELTGRVEPPTAGVVVRASQGEGTECETVTRDDGTFRVTGLADGPVTVVLLPPDGEMRVIQTRVGVEVHGRLR